MSGYEGDEVQPAPFELSARDEMDLRAYFSSYVPPPPGARSNFGSMCARLGNARNPASKEKPGSRTPWTQILDCSGSPAILNFDGEQAMIAYLDARRRFRRVCDALSRLDGVEREVLDAYHGGEESEHALGRLAGVATMTPTARQRNRSRAARGMHEPIEATVRWLAAATAPDGQQAFKDVREEAETLLASAHRQYALARRSPRSLAQGQSPQKTPATAPGGGSPDTEKAIVVAQAAASACAST
ncbi:MAG: hypothetical protein ACRELB_21695 [Polyangiaceae bacterium]